jgi:hypothetical protein
LGWVGGGGHFVCGGAFCSVFVTFYLFKIS